MKKNRNTHKDLQKIFNKILPETKKSFDMKKTQSEYRNWDSFAHMQLASEIERVFGTELTVKEILSVDSAVRFLALIEKKL